MVYKCLGRFEVCFNYSFYKTFFQVLLQSTPKGEPTIAPEMFHLVIKLMSAFEHIDKQEDQYKDRSQADLPSVLIFLPGINEIEDLFLCLSDLKLRWV